MATLNQPNLNALLKEVRIYLNEQSSDNSFWSDAELTLYINDGISQYYQEIIDRAEGQFDKVTTLNIVSGQEEITLPSDFYTMKALYKKQITRQQVLQYENNIVDSYDTSLGGGSPSTYTPKYFFRGNKLVIRPTPDFSETAGLTIDYTAFPETMIIGSDTMTAGISPIFKELIVMYAVYKAKIKEDLVNNSGASARAGAHLAEIYAKFKETVGMRSKYPVFIKPFTP